MGVARLLPILSLVLAAAVQAAEPTVFKRTVAGAEVDWSAGTIMAQAGSAADMRMPGPNAARPGAERRARAAAEVKLATALHELGLDGLAKDKNAPERAAVSGIEYQSNGGVILWLSLRFADVVPAKAAARALKVAGMPFEIAPILLAGGKEARVASATYLPNLLPNLAASACPKDAIPVRRDDKGRLVLPAASADLIDSLAGSAVVIYLEKAQP
jgi:hypothetical protein